ncbi:hypothetical protein [Paenibacillus ginsengarvi]|uniref:hypothetical protein n=1 Tax=Paenibacillus ginsengarvi TaxID=400777 RepID=UPI0018762A87|nr:hypothetical protein [Paenibacillus ginsengarvi]
MDRVGLQRSIFVSYIGKYLICYWIIGNLVVFNLDRFGLLDTVKHGMVVATGKHEGEEDA